MIKNVTIVGGGIGGLTLAHSLRKVGINCKVYEAYPIKDNLGSGIGLWRNSLECYEQLGLKNELIKHGSWMKMPSYRNWKGEVLAKPTPSFKERFTVLCIHRSDLQKTLMAPLKDSNILFPATPFVKYEQDAHGVIAQFADGKTVKSDLIVGCDGIHSVVRRQMLQNNSNEPSYLGYTYYRAIVDLSDKEYDELSDSFESWGEGKRFGYVPLKKPQVFWFAAVKTLPQLDTDLRWGNPEFKKLLLKNYGHWHHPILSIIQKTPEDLIFRTDIHKILPMEKWVEGRVVLLGDACHATAPNLAQGAGLAIEDCLELASCLQNLNNKKFATLQGALAEYQQKRMPRAKTVQLIADMVAFVGQQENPWLIFIRDMFMKWAPDFLRSRIFEASVKYSLGWNYKAPVL